MYAIETKRTASGDLLARWGKHRTRISRDYSKSADENHKRAALAVIVQALPDWELPDFVMGQHTDKDIRVWVPANETRLSAQEIADATIPISIQDERANR